MNGWKRRASRLVGVGTGLYGLSVLALPNSLARQCGLDPDSPSTRLLSVTFGVRDAASGASILAARNRDALRLALVIRGLMDGGDAIACGLLLTDRRARGRVVAVAGAWSVLSLAVAASI